MTRRRAARLGSAEFICSPIATSDTAIGSCAWTTSGRRSPSTRASCQPAWTSNSLRGVKLEEPQAFAGAPSQLAVLVREQDGVVAGFGQPVDRQQDLVLTAAPRTGRVDVKRSHAVVGRRRVPGGVRAPRASRTSGRRSARSWPR